MEQDQTGEGEGSSTTGSPDRPHPPRHHVGARLAMRQPEFRYGELLVLLLVTFFFIGSASGGRWVPFVTVVLESATLLMALLVSGAKRILYTIALISIALGIVSSLVTLFTGANFAVRTASGLNALLVLVAPITIVRGMVARRMVDLRTVLGALCLYVMFGLFFSTLFATLQLWTHQPFFVQLSDAHGSDFLYFSFVTITTVGYGDLTAARGIGRTLAASEAMLGQFYLVTVVALLVSNLGPLFGSKDAGDPPAEFPE